MSRVLGTVKGSIFKLLPPFSIMTNLGTPFVIPDASCALDSVVVHKDLTGCVRYSMGSKAYISPLDGQTLSGRTIGDESEHVLAGRGFVSPVTGNISNRVM